MILIAARACLVIITTVAGEIKLLAGGPNFRRKDIQMSRKTTSIGALAILAISLLATAASAHPKLQSASPAADVSSKVSPTEIKLVFSEGVIAKLSGLELKDETGKAVATGVPANDPKDQKQLVIPIPTPLTAGHYSVTWHRFPRTRTA